MSLFREGFLSLAGGNGLSWPDCLFAWAHKKAERLPVFNQEET
jgi:hypothetical protein